MLRNYVGRFLHSQIASLSPHSAKSLLAKLRKNTGYSFANCKNALNVNDNDYQKAEKWLHEQAQKEGWAKAQKLQDRKAGEGLIAIVMQNKLAVMLEVNCETDFVARNKEFHKLVESAATTYFYNSGDVDINNNEDIIKVENRTSQLSILPWQEQDGKTLADLLAMKTGVLGEKLQLRRAVKVKVPNNHHLGFYIHPSEETSSGSVKLGKYGTLVAFRESDKKDEVSRTLTVEQCGRQLCQHITGMNPLTIGSTSDDPSPDKDSETQMVHQEFLLDPQITVAEFLLQNGIEIREFIRYECGEVLPDAIPKLQITS